MLNVRVHTFSKGIYVMKLIFNMLAVTAVGLVAWLLVVDVKESIRKSDSVFHVRCYSGSLLIYEGRTKKRSVLNLFRGGIKFTELDTGRLMQIDGACVFNGVINENFMRN